MVVDTNIRGFSSLDLTGWLYGTKQNRIPDIIRTVKIFQFLFITLSLLEAKKHKLSIQF